MTWTSMWRYAIDRSGDTKFTDRGLGVNLQIHLKNIDASKISWEKNRGQRMEHLLGKHQCLRDG